MIVGDNIRFETTENTMDDCLSIYDKEDQLTTDFGSEIVLSPCGDAEAVIHELNVQCAIVAMLREQLESYEDPQDIDYWIKDVREELE